MKKFLFTCAAAVVAFNAQAQTIPNLPAAPSVSSTDLIAVDQSVATTVSANGRKTRRATLGQLLSQCPAATVSAFGCVKPDGTTITVSGGVISAVGGGGGSAVSSVFTRTGAVTAQTGDYTIAQVTNGLSNALAQYHFFIGNGSGVAADTALSGDCTFGASGIVCTKTNGTAFGALATLGVGTGLTSSGGNLNLTNQLTAGGPIGSATVVPIITYNAQGQLTVVSSASIAPAWSSITGTPTTLSGYGIASPLSVAQGGTAATSASGTALDNITGFSGTGILVRTGAGAYSQTNVTGAAKDNGSGTLSPAACADLSNAAATCSIAAWSGITGTPTTLSGYGITSPLPYAQGGCNATSQSGCTNNLFPSPTRAGDIAYWNGSSWTTLAGNNSGTQFLQENSSGVAAWGTGSGTGTVTSITGGGGCVSGTGGQTAITASSTVYCAPGSANKLRNASLAAWFHGCVSGACTITTSGGWCAEGVYVKPTGASVTCQQSTTCPTGNPTYDCVKITSAASVTAIVVRFVVESYDAAILAGQQVTFQLLAKNNCGASVTPTIAATYPTAQDNYTSTGTDLSSANMQALGNGSSGTEAYSWAASSSINNGDSVDIGIGACGASASDSFTIGGGFDLRVTPGVTTGTVANPPTPEIRDAFGDIARNQRFYACSYNNGIAPGTSTLAGALTVIAYGSSYGAGSITLRTTLRADGAFSYWDLAGNASKISSFSGGTQTNNVTLTSTITPGENGILLNTTATTGSSNNIFNLHYCADATISGA